LVNEYDARYLCSYEIRMITISLKKDFSHLWTDQGIVPLRKRITMFGKLNSQQIDQLIYSQVIGRIGCHADGITYVVPISYAYDGYCIYGHTLEGMKVNMMRKNPKICFEIDNTKDLANWQSAICWGTFEEITDQDERLKALKALEARRLPIITSETMHLTSQWPFPSGEINKLAGIVFRIVIKDKTGRFEKSESETFYAS